MIKVYKNNIIEGLKILADYNFQKNALLNPKGHYIWLFVENYLWIFDDNGLLNAWKAKQIVFNPKADNALLVLYNMMNEIDDKLPDRVIVDLPEMDMIRKEATQILNMIAGK